VQLTELERRIRGYIAEKRFQHTLGVRDTALRLSRTNGVSSEKAQTAALLHDVARDFPIEVMRGILRQTGAWSVKFDDFSDNPLLLHPYAGRVIAQTEFGVEDEEILRSIELHTTGGSSMGALEKVIFVSDFIEPGRDFHGVETARRLASKSLDETILYIYKFMLRHLLKKGLFICKNTLLGYNEIILKGKK
jgi:predicted HD superfamily hydrolase involved in NAD metabolism